MNRYTFVRHGQSQANFEKVIAGITNVALTQQGIEQAKQTAKLLASKKFDAIFCSPLTRAMQTAQEIVQFHKNTPFFVDHRLAERNYGVFENQPHDKMNFDPKGKLFWDTQANIQIDGAETFEQYLNKVKSFFEDINKQYQNKNILIISHGGVHRIISFLQKNSQKNLLQNNIQNTACYDFEI